MDDRSALAADDAVTDVTVAAVHWHERMQSAPTPAEIAAFEAWQAADERNAQAYAAVVRTIALASEIRNAPELLPIRHETLTRVAIARPRYHLPKTQIAAGFMAAVTAGIIWLAVAGGPFQLSPATQDVRPEVTTRTYETRAGERMTVTLEDRSVVHLNTRSILQVDYTVAARRLKLLSGEALFEVAHAPHRPFTVAAGGRTITALGTMFDVRFENKALQVALVEGAVVVRQGAGNVMARMHPNDLLLADGKRLAVTHHADIRRFISWKDGVILFNDTALTDAVAELNRYSNLQIVIADPSIASLRISGSFPTSDTKGFLEALQLLFPVAVSNDGNRTVLTGSRKSAG